jgi:hypothetical protein
MESGPIAFAPSRSESPVPPTSSEKSSTSTAAIWAYPSCIAPRRENGAIAFADPDNWRIVLMPNPIPLAA